MGGAGDDKFFVGSGGGNIISGGEGADRFWIVSGEIAEAANTIVDFEIGSDVIGILVVQVWEFLQILWNSEPKWMVIQNLHLVETL